ncbi:MAG: hypothetical protein HFJ60_01355 [Clostridia bacterium]|nr:hypothetical protein [Clostridia bacterium]
MGFRIMQLQYEQEKEEFCVKNGILSRSPYHKLNFKFGEIQSLGCPYQYDFEFYNIHEYSIYDIEDGFKRIEVSAPYIMKVEREKAIFLIIQYADSIWTKKDVERIAGRYPYEGIFILKPNDKISVKKGSVTEEFVALQFENKMYLVKIHTD